MNFNDYLKQNFNIESCTTFWSDFSIADKFGTKAIKDTYRKSKYWKKDVKMWTELVIVLNTKCWNYYNKGNMKLSNVYSELYHMADMEASKFKGEDASYYFNITD